MASPIGWPSASRAAPFKTYEANIKWRALRQNSDNSMPVSVTLYSAAMANGLKWSDPTRENFFTSRLSYANQAVAAKKWSSKLSTA